MEVDLYREKYKALVASFSKNKPIMIVDDNKLLEIDALVKSIIKAKLSEAHHKRDNGSEYKRFYTGFLGEAAMD